MSYSNVSVKVPLQEKIPEFPATLEIRGRH